MGRSSAGPSDENRKLRSALLSRTFDSQIFFGSSGEGGGGEGEEGEARGRRRNSGANGSDDDGRPLPLPPPAGGGKLGRVAEGAAWTPGGRRLIPGSRAFTSHLGSGMMAKKATSGEDDDGASTTSSHALLTASKSRAAAAAAATRAPPVWVPRLDPQSNTPAAITADARPPGSVSLAQLVRSGENGDPSSWDGQNHRQADVEIPPASKRAPRSQPPQPSIMDHTRSPFSGEEYEERRRPDRPTGGAVTGRAGEGGFDWWGGGTASDAGNEPAREGAVGGTRVSRPRPKVVSDTYKSSLVFG